MTRSMYLESSVSKSCSHTVPDSIFIARAGQGMPKSKTLIVDRPPNLKIRTEWKRGLP